MSNPNSMNNGNFAVDPLWGNNQGNQSPVQDGANPNFDDELLGEPNQEPVATSEPQVEQLQAVDGVGEKEQSRDRNEAIESLRRALISALPSINNGKGSPEWYKARYEGGVDDFMDALSKKPNVTVPDAENNGAVEKIARQIALVIEHDVKAESAREKIQKALTKRSNKVKAAVASALATISFVIGTGVFSSAQANAVTAYDPAPIEQADANNETQSGDETGEPELVQQIQEQNDFINGHGQASESDEAEAQAEQESAGGGVIEATLNESVGQGGDTDGGNGETTGVGLLGSLKNLDSAMKKVSEKVAEAGEKLEARRLEADSILDTAKEVKSSLKAGGLNVSDSTLFKVVADTLRDKGVHTTLDTVKNVLNEAKKQGVDLDVETDKDTTKAEEAETNKDTKAEEAETATGYDFEVTVDGVNQSLHFDKRVDGYDHDSDPFFIDTNKLSPGSFTGPVGNFMEAMNKIANSSAPLALYSSIMRDDIENLNLVDINNLANEVEQDAGGYADMVNELQRTIAESLNGGEIKTRTIPAGDTYMTFYSWKSADESDLSYIYAQPDLTRDQDVKVYELLDEQGQNIFEGKAKEFLLNLWGIPLEQGGNWRIGISSLCDQITGFEIYNEQVAPVVNVDEQVEKTNYEVPEEDTITNTITTTTTTTTNTPTPDTPTPDTPTPDTPDIPEVDHSKSGDPNAGNYQQYMGATDREAETTKQNYEAVDATEDNHVDPNVAPESEVYDVSTNYASDDMYVVDNAEQAYENNSLDTAYEASTEGWQSDANINTGQKFDQGNVVTEDYADPNSVGTVSRYDYEEDNGVAGSDVAADADVSSEAGGME